MPITFSRGKTIRVIAAIVAAPLLMTACSSGGTAASPTASKPQGGQTVTYWSHLKEGEVTQVVLAKAIAAWEKESGNKVQVEWQGRQVVQKIVPTLNTNNVPDLVDSGYGKLAPVLASTGQAASVDEFLKLEVDGKPVSELIPAQYLTDRQKVDGHFWMIPYWVTGDAIWFDKKTSPELSTDAPKDWDGFIKLLDTMKAAGKTPLAIDGDISGYNAYWFTNLYLQQTGPGGFYDLAADKTGEKWTGTAAQEAAKRVEQLVKGGYFIEGFAASKWPAQQQAWATGKAQLLFNGSWIPSETATYATQGFEYDSFQLPKLDLASDSIARSDPTGFAIPAKSDAKEAAGSLAVYLIRKDMQQLIATEGKQLPLRNDIDVLPSLASNAKAIREAKSLFQQNDAVAFPGYIEKVFWPISDQLVTGKITASEFTAKMKDAQVAYWKEQG